MLERLIQGNQQYIQHSDSVPREKLAANGQHPHAVVIACSDSRVVPELIFDATLGELFVIRVAGNVLDDQQLGSIQYAVEHLGCRLVVMLGHTGCGAVAAALAGHAEGYVLSIVNDIVQAIGAEKDPDRAARANVLHGVERIRTAFPDSGIEVRGAMYDIRSGEVACL